MIKVSAEGRLTKDAKVFTYGGNKTGVSFTIASNSGYGGDDQEPDYLDCVVFNRDENLAQYLKMGDQIIAFGDLSITYTPEYGKNVKLIVSDFRFGAKKQ